MAVFKRCKLCRKEGKGSAKDCSHKEAAWCVKLRIHGEQVLRTVGPRKRDAEAYEMRLRNEMRVTGTIRTPKPILFDDFYKKWFQERVKSECRLATQRNYEFLITRFTMPLLSKKLLTEITLDDLMQIRTSMLEGEKAISTTNNVIMVLKVIFLYAKETGYLKEPPTEFLRYVSTKDSKTDVRSQCLEPDEIKALLKYSDEPYKTIVTVAIGTGLRKGELLGLRWRDINWVKNRIHVENSLYWADSKYIKTGESRWKLGLLKTPLSRRTIPLSAEVKKALEIHKIISRENRHGLVFANSVGGPMHMAHFLEKGFYPAMERAGIRRIPFHGLRHTFASLLVNQNANPKIVQKLMGHSDIKVTLNTYAHLFSETMDNLSHTLSFNCLSDQKASDTTGIPKFPQTTLNSVN